MKGLLKKGGAWIAVAILSPAVLMAQDKVEASVGADLVSGYIWRGQDLGNVSIQPSLSIAYKGFSLSAWGSVGFEGLLVQQRTGVFPLRSTRHEPHVRGASGI